MTDKELQFKAVGLRRTMLQLIYSAGAGHTGGAALEKYFGWEVCRHE